MSVHVNGVGKIFWGGEAMTVCERIILKLGDFYDFD